MLRVVVGQALVLTHFLIGDMEYVPDTETVTIELSSFTGESLFSEAVSAQHQAWIVPAGVFSLGADQFEKFLSVSVEFVSDGVAQIYREQVRVQRNIFLYVDEQSVRGLLGASPEELPDADIDMYSSYVQITRDHETDLFGDELTIRKANELVLYHQALHQLDSLPNKLMMVRQVDDARQTRFAKLDIDGLRAKFHSRYNALLDELNLASQEAEAPLLEFVSRPDIITGQ